MIYQLIIQLFFPKKYNLGILRKKLQTHQIKRYHNFYWLCHGGSIRSRKMTCDWKRQLHRSYLLFDISRLKYMFIMYIYVTGVLLDKVPNTIFYKNKKKKKWDLWKTITPVTLVPQFIASRSGSHLARRKAELLSAGRGTVWHDSVWEWWSCRGGINTGCFCLLFFFFPNTNRVRQAELDCKCSHHISPDVIQKSSIVALRLVCEEAKLFLDQSPQVSPASSSHVESSCSEY